MAMHSNWNPWHGCIKCSEGCQNCYVYFLDSMRGKNGADIYKTKTGFKYPLSKDRRGKYKIQSGEMIERLHDVRFFSDLILTFNYSFLEGGFFSPIFLIFIAGYKGIHFVS